MFPAGTYLLWIAALQAADNAEFDILPKGACGVPVKGSPLLSGCQPMEIAVKPKVLFVDADIKFVVMGGAFGCVLALCVALLLHYARKNRNKVRKMVVNFLSTEVRRVRCTAQSTAQYIAAQHNTQHRTQHAVQHAAHHTTHISACMD